MEPEEWAKFTEDYEDKMISLSGISIRQQQILNNLRKGKILNIGCGCVTGLNEELVKDGNEVIALDFCKPMLEKAKGKFMNKKLKYLFANASNIPFDNETFDTVIAVNSILTEKREETQNIINEVYRILKNGGKFVSYLCSYDCNENFIKGKEKEELLDIVGCEVKLDEKEKRIWTPHGFQCFHTPETIKKMMAKSNFNKFDHQKIICDSKEEILMIKRAYKNLGIIKYPIWVYFLVGEK